MSVTALPHAETWLKRGEFAAQLKVSVRTVDQWIADGMPSVRFGGCRRIKATTAEAWLMTRGSDTVPGPRRLEDR